MAPAGALTFAGRFRLASTVVDGTKTPPGHAEPVKGGRLEKINIRATRLNSTSARYENTSAQRRGKERKCNNGHE